MKNNPVTRIAVVDGEHQTKELARAIVAAGFEAVQIVVGPKSTPREVVKNLVGAQVQMVLLDHQMCSFSGTDVVVILPTNIIVVTTSEHPDTEKYTSQRIYGKDRMNSPSRFQATVERIRQFATR